MHRQRRLCNRCVLRRSCTRSIAGHARGTPRLFRPIFLGGFIAVSLGLFFLPEVSGLGFWFALVVLTGCGVGAVATVAPLFVIDFTPKSEWEPRIGWLQSFNGGGQLAGLLVAGIVAGGQFAHGFWLGSGFALLGLLVGQVGLPTDGHHRQIRLPSLAWGRLIHNFQSGPTLGGLLQHSYHLQRAAFGRLALSSGPGFVRFLVAWALISFGVAPFFAYYPLLMESSYGIAPRLTAFVYALSAGVGVTLFVLTGRVANRGRSRFAFQTGLALRMAGFSLLGVLALISLSGQVLFAIVGFILVALAWPILSVSGTALAARLTPTGEGAAMGLLAASNAVATIFGTFVSGPLVAAYGYKCIPLIAVAGLAIAGMLMGPWSRAPEDDIAAA